MECYLYSIHKRSDTVCYLLRRARVERLESNGKSDECSKNTKSRHGSRHQREPALLDRIIDKLIVYEILDITGILSFLVIFKTFHLLNVINIRVSEMFLVKYTISGLRAVEFPQKLLFLGIVTLYVAYRYMKILTHLVDVLQMLICVHKYSTGYGKHTRTYHHICQIQAVIRDVKENTYPQHHHIHNRKPFLVQFHPHILLLAKRSCSLLILRSDCLQSVSFVHIVSSH